jgi:hypothetical protein
MRKWITRLLLGVTALAALGAGYAGLMRAGYVHYNRFDRRDRGALRTGDLAPDLKLSLYAGGSMSLSSFWGRKPVFLVFGSCT